MRGLRLARLVGDMVLATKANEGFAVSAAFSASLALGIAATAQQARVAGCSEFRQAARGRRQVRRVDAEDVYGLREVGSVPVDRPILPRSEGLADPDAAVVRQDQPRAFDLMQPGVTAWTTHAGFMANVTELIDDVEEDDKRSDNDKYLDRSLPARHRPTRPCDHLMTNGARRSATIQSGRADITGSPELAIGSPRGSQRRQNLTRLSTSQ